MAIYAQLEPCLWANFVSKFVRAANRARMSIDLCKRRARWKRNKADKRLRDSIYPRRLSDRFTALVLAERDRRAAAHLSAAEVIRPGHGFFERGSFERTIRFAADVWAADTWLQEEWGPKGAMPRRVAAWLKTHGAPHGYTENSLPKMIRKARERVEQLERPQPWNWGRPIWAPFDPAETSD